MDNGPSEVIPINIGLILLGPVSMLILFYENDCASYQNCSEMFNLFECFILFSFFTRLKPEIDIVLKKKIEKIKMFFFSTKIKINLKHYLEYKMSLFVLL